MPLSNRRNGQDEPSLTLSRLELLGLASTADTTRETAEGNDLLVFGNVAEVRVRLRELEACIHTDPSLQSRRPWLMAQSKPLTRQGSRDLTHVLEVRPEVLPASTRSCRYTYTINPPVWDIVKV